MKIPRVSITADSSWHCSAAEKPLYITRERPSRSETTTNRGPLRTGWRGNGKLDWEAAHRIPFPEQPAAS